MNEADIYNIYHLKCDHSISKTVDYITRNQAAYFVDEIPIDILVESLNNAKISNHNASKARDAVSNPLLPLSLFIEFSASSTCSIGPNGHLSHLD